MASQLPIRKNSPNTTKRPQITYYQYKERCSPRSHTLPHSIQPIHSRPPTTPNPFHPHNIIRRRLNHCHHTQKPRYRNFNHSRLPNTNPNLAGRKPDDSISKQILLNNIPIPFNKTPKILGLTLHPYLNFSKHIQNTTSAAIRKLNILKTVANTDIHNNIQTSIAIYKQFIRPTINYASPVWHPLLSDHNLTTLQTTQNKALRTITGCTHSTPQQHLHNETKILPIRNHLEMIGTQFYAKTRLPTHPCHKTLLQPTPQRLKQPPSSTGALYKQILNHIPPPPPNTNTTKNIQTKLN